MQTKGLGKLSLKDYKPLGDVVFEYLRDAILTGKLKPGERLMEIQLAEKLGVSRTPVREAMKKLEQENFIEMVPRKGAYVKDIHAKDMLDVLEIRALLEGFAAFQAASAMSDKDIRDMEKLTEKFEKAILLEDKEGMIETDNKFHDIIYKSTKNDKLKEIIKGLQDQFHRFRIIYFSEFDDYGNISEGHKEILEAIKLKDGEKAREVAEKHINIVERSVLEWSSEKHVRKGK
ncbi:MULTISPECIES: GntR family transcriptional regulator [unclassified Fusibacter]|uniref:GntR family transcriptional regulator n=1 Tax=unclassified Fusibacter TaxID=2624464 RepID=UPI0010126200|nr:MULTISPECIES: GntR family transcriptional regulator [unclassified Fusibacter]MCK8059299.1 GntR family transcriptional regulator [Fusibacter sp. A2]NPE21237.1 GntR family transcriptional regulator [Fusibacter sp. A1]RXV62504.1 GntR family transcriptional regulator [Fusibacter sp. A1]